MKTNINRIINIQKNIDSKRYKYGGVRKMSIYLFGNKGDTMIIRNRIDIRVVEIGKLFRRRSWESI